MKGSKDKIRYCLLIAFIGLSIVVSMGYVLPFDQMIELIVGGLLNPNVTKLMQLISNLGNHFMIMVIFLGVFFMPLTRNRFALPVITATTASMVANSLLKNIIKRARPTFWRLTLVDGYSYPSWHAMVNMTLYMIIFLLANKYMINRMQKRLVCVTSLLMAFLIGVSRIYLGVHHPSDVIGGWLLGAFIAEEIYNFYFS